jgi:uncharacterized protein YjiK
VSKALSKLFAFLLILAITLSTLSGLSVQHVQSAPGRSVTVAAPVTSIDLSTYVRIDRFDLPEPTRTAHPPGSLLAQEASAITYNWDTDTLFVVGAGEAPPQPCDQLRRLGLRRL